MDLCAIFNKHMYRVEHLVANAVWVDVYFLLFRPVPGSAFADGKLAEVAEH